MKKLKIVNEIYIDYLLNFTSLNIKFMIKVKTICLLLLALSVRAQEKEVIPPYNIKTIAFSQNVNNTIPFFRRFVFLFSRIAHLIHRVGGKAKERQYGILGMALTLILSL